MWWTVIDGLDLCSGNWLCVEKLSWKSLWQGSREERGTNEVPSRQFTTFFIFDLLSYCSALSKVFSDLPAARTSCYTGKLEESAPDPHNLHYIFFLLTLHSLSFFTLLPEQPLTPGLLLTWIYSISWHYRGSISAPCRVCTGVPQGSLLGLFMFSL